jgi:hypothetical protein
MFDKPACRLCKVYTLKAAVKFELLFNQLASNFEDIPFPGFGGIWLKYIIGLNI